MSLFELKNFVMHSGDPSKFKIECDALTLEDWRTVAFLIFEKFDYAFAVGVPNGGAALQKELVHLNNPKSNTVLIVDDVLTTGNSMEEMKKAIEVANKDRDYDIKGVVLFARGKCPDWVTPIFQMWQQEGNNAS